MNNEDVREIVYAKKKELIEESKKAIVNDHDLAVIIESLEETLMDSFSETGNDSITLAWNEVISYLEKEYDYENITERSEFVVKNVIKHFKRKGFTAYFEDRWMKAYLIVSIKHKNIYQYILYKCNLL